MLVEECSKESGALVVVQLLTLTTRARHGHSYKRTHVGADKFHFQPGMEQGWKAQLLQEEQVFFYCLIPSYVLGIFGTIYLIIVICASKRYGLMMVSVI